MADNTTFDSGSSMFTGNRDESIDLKNLIATKKTEDTTTSPKKDDDIIVVDKKLSPLEQAKLDNKSKGVEISKKDFEKGSDDKVLKSEIEERRTQDMNKYITDMDTTMQKRQAVTLMKKPEDDQEKIEMMEEINSVAFNPDGSAYFNFKKDISIEDPDTEESKWVTVKDTERMPKYVRIRTADDPSYEQEKEYFESLDENDESTDNTSSEQSNSSSSDETAETTPEDDKKKKTIQIVIDKTGLGSDVIFTEEEKAKILEAEEIKLTEVQVLDLATVTTRKMDKSFQETVQEQQLSNARTTICFPASGFRAHMNGLTYGEMGDIALSMDSVTVDQYNKRMAIIYNKMTNISTGAFKTYEDFLKGFAYTDIPLALYGLFVATFPEINSIQLRCGKEGCRKSFEWKYYTRSVLRLDKCDQVLLDKMEELASADAADYDKIKERSAVMSSKFIKLPYSNYIVEMGIISSYEFLYNFIPLLDENVFKAAFGDDINHIYANNSLLLSTIRSVRVPDGSGAYYLCEGYKDIMDSIYTINPEEIKILAAITNKLTTEYQPMFSFEQVKCPHCGNDAGSIDVTMDDLVFQTLQRLMSTEIDVSNIRAF